MFRSIARLVFNRSLTTLRSSGPLHRNPIPFRFFTAPPLPVQPRVPIQVMFLQVRKLLAKPDTVVIDVRDPKELAKDGRISETAKNIPLDQLETAFGLPAEEFQNKYGFPKPTRTTTIVTHCKLGIRATKGAIALSKAGYENVIVYPGIVDWVECGGDLLK